MFVTPSSRGFQALTSFPSGAIVYGRLGRTGAKFMPRMSPGQNPGGRAFQWRACRAAGPQKGRWTMVGVGGLILVSVVVLRAIRAATRPDAVVPPPVPLCPDCAKVYMAREAGSDEIILYCDCDSESERIEEEIVECSSFCARNPETGAKHVCGFDCDGCAREYPTGE